MNVFRISRSKYIEDLSGYGAKIYGGRWNRPGVPVLYTSQARSLAMLELIVHFTSKEAFRRQYKFACLWIDPKFIVDVEEDIHSVDLRLPNNEHLWKITDKFFIDKKELCIKVPSVLIPNEFNYLINPIHPYFQNVKLQGLENAIVDKRYFAVN
ncbi:MAG: RES family NAD+ phosphorylase [Saprospiraceae bacterium]